jgi:hypothetical protein
MEQNYCDVCDDLSETKICDNCLEFGNCCYNCFAIYPPNIKICDDCDQILHNYNLLY